MGVTGGEGCPCRGLVNMEEVLRILSPLNPLSPQGVDARGRAAGEPGLGGARVEGRESGGPEAPGFDQSGRGTCCTPANPSQSLFACHPQRFKCPLCKIHARFFRGGRACMQM